MRQFRELVPKLIQHVFIIFIPRHLLIKVSDLHPVAVNTGTAKRGQLSDNGFQERRFAQAISADDADLVTAPDIKRNGCQRFIITYRKLVHR